MTFVKTGDRDFDEIRDPANLDLDIHPTLGTSLAEVFSVIINNTDGKEHKLYGTIKIVDDNIDKGPVCIYDIEPADADFINQSNYRLLLSNLDRAISAASGSFTVKLDLKDANNGDAEFINGSFSWVEKDDDCYDKCLIESVVGKSGSAMVYYIVSSVAVEAIVTVEFFKGDSSLSDEQRINEDSSSEGDYTNDDQLIKRDSASNEDVYVSFYGTISAYYKWFEDQKSDNFRITVFEESDEPNDVRDKYLFSLWRSIVSVPGYSALSIEAQLYGYIRGGNGNKLLWKVK